MRSKLLLTTLAALLCTAVLPLYAADQKKEGEWEKLGEKKVGSKEERDVIEVAGTQRYTAISFRVEKGDVAVEDVKVTFDNDETFSPDTKLVFKEGDRSQKIDLPGKSRAIKRIRFLYKTMHRGEEAVVVVFGKIGDTGKK